MIFNRFLKKRGSFLVLDRNFAGAALHFPAKQVTLYGKWNATAVYGKIHKT